MSIECVDSIRTFSKSSSFRTTYRPRSYSKPFTIWSAGTSFESASATFLYLIGLRSLERSWRKLIFSSRDLSPIRYKKVAEADSKEVPADQIVKGFEYERGRYVVLKDEDFEKVRIESTHSIDITDFVDLEQVDPKFFYKPYFLEPQKGGEKSNAVF